MKCSAPPSKTSETNRGLSPGLDTAQNSHDFKPTVRVLHLNLKAEYFDQIASGVKPFEFRLCTPYWAKRLKGKQFDQVHVKKGYPTASDTSRILVRPWRGFEVQTIQHPHFGKASVQVFAIRVNG